MHDSRMIISLPDGLLAEFKRGAKDLGKVSKFHQAQGHEDVAAAVDIAADAANRL